MSRNIIILLAVISLALLTGFFFNYLNKKELKPVVASSIPNILEVKIPERKWKIKNIQIGSKNYEIYITESRENQTTGLAAFEEIKENQGMIFEFPEEDYHAFWMKNMKFDIDMIFLDQNNQVIQIFENVQKSSYKSDTDFQTYMPKLKSKFVIEIKSGETKKNGLRTGDVIIFK